MYWQDPAYLWIELLPGLLLAGWIVSEVAGMRRLKVFGDPLVLGVSVPWGLRIAALFLLLLGIACATAVIPLPAMNQANAAADVHTICILLDLHSLEGADDQTWESYDAAIQALAEQDPGTRFSAIALGSPSRVIVYPTVDKQGFQILLARLRFETLPGNAPDLAKGMAAYADSQRDQSRAARSFIVTALPADEVERISDSKAGRDLDFVYAVVSGGRPPIQYARRSISGDLVWTTQVADLRQALRADRGRIRSGRALNPTQWFALTALILLCAEYICGLRGRSRVGGMQFV